MDSSTKKLIAALHKKREIEGYSLRQLSPIIGISFSTLARIERGDGEPDNNSRIRILEWLGQYADDLGLSFEDVALAHFRANKNVDSKTVDCLLQAASVLKKEYGSFSKNKSKADLNHPDSPTITLSKPEMEEMAQNFRKDLGIKDDDILDALGVRIEGVKVFTPKQASNLDLKCITHLQGKGCDSWSAMSVPLDENNDTWAILRNDKHLLVRQRVTFLEECWHIMQDHKLTKIAKIGNAYGRTYEHNEEHDAFYLASASLLPEKVINQAIKSKMSVEEVAKKYGTSFELVEYRIKRLGLWREYKGKNVQLSE